MRLRIDLRGSDGSSVADWARAQGERGKIALTAALAAAADGLKLDMRAAIRNAGFGERLPNAVGSNVFPKGGRASFRAAGTVFARGERAAAIFQAWSTGVTIRGGRGQWLAIPTRSAPRQLRGTPPTPASVEAYFGRPLRYVYLRRRDFGLLVMDEVTAARSGRGLRNATRRRRAQGRRVASVVMFLVIPEARIPRRLDFDSLAERWSAAVPDLIERLLPED
ncbi:MAG: DUF6441 family protein [Alphaproteobacteria bacterium]